MTKSVSTASSNTKSTETDTKRSVTNPLSVGSAMTGLNIDSIIERLMSIGRPQTGIGTTISEQEIHDLLLASKQLFMEQPMMLELKAPVYICGDTHGQFNDLMRIFNRCGFPHVRNYLFLGDYVDRGRMNIETILILLAFKLKYPLNFFLIRGNHETALVNRIYGFYEELNRRYRSPRLYTTFQDVFDSMPLTAIVGERILCMHGGLSPELFYGSSLDLLNKIERPLPDPPNPSLPLDLLWADPDSKTEKFKFSIRGVSCTFGPEVVTTICQKYNLDMICRAHQVVQDGYEFFANRKLVTIFSAPHYCGQFDNAAAVLNVSRTMECSFRVFRPKFPTIQVKQSEPAQLTVYGKL